MKVYNEDILTLFLTLSSLTNTYGFPFDWYCLISGNLSSILIKCWRYYIKYLVPKNSDRLDENVKSRNRYVETRTVTPEEWTMHPKRPLIYSITSLLRTVSQLWVIYRRVEGVGSSFTPHSKRVTFLQSGNVSCCSMKE